jgi:23S rRNA pseudouridine1911/1915/1917 synthase
VFPDRLPQFIVSPEDEGLRLDKYLALPSRLGSRARVADALARGKIFLNDREAGPANASHRVAAGDRLVVWADRPGSAARRAGSHHAGDLRLLFEDAAMIVVDKPPGLLSVPLERRAQAASARDQVEDHLRSSGHRRAFVVHRIDLDTSGVVVFAKTREAQAALRTQFRRREPERVYWTMLIGHPQPAAGMWRDRIAWDDRALIQKPAHASNDHGADAISEYRVLERFRGASLVEVRLHTGKRNQIRIQAQLHGHPLVGERRYVDENDATPPLRFRRQALHARRLTLAHPIDGRPLTFEAPLPPDFEELLRRLRNRPT